MPIWKSTIFYVKINQGFVLSFNCNSFVRSDRLLGIIDNGKINGVIFLDLKKLSTLLIIRSFYRN